jgi:signal transduction histidine kinase
MVPSRSSCTLPKHALAETRAGAATLTVTNSGPVIPPAELARLFQPFARLAGQRTAVRNGFDHGLGLGLPIVAAIATAHDAAVDARARPTGASRSKSGSPPAG